MTILHEMTNDGVITPPDFVLDNLCYLVRGGSYAYGTNNEKSDNDIIGYCIPPSKYLFPTSFGFVYGYDDLPNFEQFTSHGISYNDNEYDITIYNITKFSKLAIKGNPNVIEILYFDQDCILFENETGKKFRKNKHKFISQECYNRFMGFAKSHLHKIQYRNKKGKRKELLDKFGYDCYLEENTEFLTEKGFKKFDDIKNEKLATVNLNGLLEWQESINKIDTLYSGSLYTIEPHGSKCEITENHNLLVSDTHRSKKNNWSIKYIENESNWRLQSLKSLLDKGKSVFHYYRSCSNNIEDSTVDDDILVLTGLYLSEGTAQFKSNGEIKCIRITQTKNGKQEVFDFMDSISEKYNFKKYDYEKETIWISHHNEIKDISYYFGHKKEKEIHYNINKFLSRRQVELIWNGLMMGDGTFYDDSFVYYSSSKKLIDSIQMMMTCAGINTTLNGPYLSQTDYGDSWMYQLYRPLIDKQVGVLYLNRLINKKDINNNTKKAHPIKKETVKNKRVVCFEVPNGTLITRNSGKIAIHGNCKDASHLIRAYTQAKNILKDGKIVPREESDFLKAIKEGKYSLDYILTLSNNWEDRLKKLKEETNISYKPDFDSIRKLLMEVI